LKEKIGEGCNGVVRKCIDRKTGITYVVKISQVDDEQIIYLRKTFALIRKLNH
jgi:serine/threonine protein kinase